MRHGLVGSRRGTDSEMMAAGLYWSARAEMAAGRPEAVRLPETPGPTPGLPSLNLRQNLEWIERETVRRALDHGAAGYIPKSAGLDELREAIRSVLACEQWLPPALRGAVTRTRSSPADADLAARLASLTPQQFRVLTLVAQGLLNKQIADRLDIQERTVKAHLSVIFEKLGARNRTQASVILRELEIGDPSRHAAD